MRTSKLSQFFRNVQRTLSHSPQVRTAVGRLERQVEQQLHGGVRRAADGFEAAKPRPPVALAKPAPASQAGDLDFVTSQYRELLGREPDPDGLRAHLGGLAQGMSRESIRQVFLNSAEYRARQAAPPADPTPPATPAPAPRGLGPVPLEGFDQGKLADLNHRSVKYLFGRVATHFPLDSVKDKASAEALLNRMVPELTAAGLDIVGVKGDRLLMKTPLGLESIDVVRGAGSGNPGWWWGADGTVATPAEVASFAALTTRPPPTTPPVTPPPPGTLVEPGAPLSTVPLLPEYAGANLDTSSASAAALSAARWAKQTYPELFARAGDRQVCFEIMTRVVGALRVAGFDATRVVNHADRPVGDGWRYGSDAVVVNGTVFDVFGGMGESNTPQALDAGPHAADRLRE